MRNFIFFVKDSKLINKSYRIKTIVEICRFAYENNMRLNDFYCARKNDDRITNDRCIEFAAIIRGEGDSKKIYIFPEYDEVVANLKGFKYREVDGVYVGIQE